jgi:hypothetical protein
MQIVFSPWLWQCIFGLLVILKIVLHHAFALRKPVSDLSIASQQ